MSLRESSASVVMILFAANLMACAWPTTAREGAASVAENLPAVSSMEEVIQWIELKR